MQYMFPERMNLNHSNAYPRGIPGLQKAHYKYKLDYTENFWGPKNDIFYSLMFTLESREFTDTRIETRNGRFLWQSTLDLVFNGFMRRTILSSGFGHAPYTES